MPFHSLRDAEISYKVIQGERPAMPTNASGSGISDRLWGLLAKCWNEDPSKRPRIDEILQHLSQEPALRLTFPPSKFPLTPSLESVYESGTHKYGNGSWFEPVSWRAYSSIADIFVTASMRTPIEGMLGVTLRRPLV